MTDIFISYSHKDEAWKDALKQQLQVLQLHTEFAIWDDRQIQVGDDWKPAIEQAIAQAKVAILLVSSDFLASEFVTRQEIPKFLQRREQEGLRIMPVIVRPCAWAKVSWLASLQGAVKDNKPLSQYHLGSYESEEVFSAITEKVHDLLIEAKQAEAQKKAPVHQTVQSQRFAEIEPEVRVVDLGEQSLAPAVTTKLESGQSGKWLLGIFIAAILGSTVWWLKQDKAIEPKTTPVVQVQPTPEPTIVPVAKPQPEQRRLAFEPEMVDIPAGSFTMGCLPERDLILGMDKCEDNELPAHEVKIKAFHIGKYEVTFDEWDACEKANACPHAEDEGWGRGRRPVINVSWDDSQTYLKWLNQQTGKNYRLPTEAEWEYAARGGKKGAYPWGTNQISCDQARYGYTDCKSNYTVEVGSYPVNGFGLYDIIGNVWELTQSNYTETYGAAVQQDRVLRGGSWGGDPQFARSANRLRYVPTTRNFGIGFRISRTP